MLRFQDKRFFSACALRFCEIGIFVASWGYANLGLLGTYSVSVLPYFYLAQAALAFVIIGFSRNLISSNPQKYTLLYHGTAAIMAAVFYSLILIDVPGAIFVGSVFLIIFAFQTIAVVGNSISLAFDIREFRQISKPLVISAGLGGVFFAVVSPFLIHAFGGQNLILINLILYLGCLSFSSQLKPLHEPNNVKEERVNPIKTPFFRLILIYAICAVFILESYDYLFKLVLKHEFDENLIGIISTAFIGLASSLLILTQLFGQRWNFLRYGIANTLLFFPFCTVLLGVINLVLPGLTTIAAALGLLAIAFDGPCYIAYQVLLNSLPRKTQIFAKSQLYLLSMTLGRIAVASIILLLPNGHEASIRTVVAITILFGFLAFFLVRHIRIKHRDALKGQVEQTRYLQYEEIYFSRNLAIPDVANIIPLIGHSYSVYEMLYFLKNSDINPIPLLMKNLEKEKDIVNFQARVAIIGKLPSKEAESALIELLQYKSTILPNAIAVMFALRALNFELSDLLRKAVEAKLVEESQLITSLTRAIISASSEHTKLEIESRLQLSIHRFFYYFATIDNTRSILNILPKILGELFLKSNQLNRANAIEYLETITENRSLRTLLLETIEQQPHPLKQDAYFEVISRDPWLSQVDQIKIFTPGENMDNTEKILFLRRVKLFENLPAEILELIVNSLTTDVYIANQQIFSKGDISDRMHMVVSGIVDIELKGKKVSKISQYEVFGELGCIDDSARSADAKANTDVVLLSIYKQEFNQLIQDVPELSTTIIRQLLSYVRKQKDEVEAS